MRELVTCDYKLDPEYLDQMKRHAAVHVAEDWSKLRDNPPTSHPARYLMAYTALKEFALVGTLGNLNRALGAIALLSSVTSMEVLKFLRDLVAEKTGQSLALDQFKIEAFEIKRGVCVVITLPMARYMPEAHMVGIVTDASFTNPSITNPEREFSIHYFALEKDAFDAVLCGWQLIGENLHKNYGVKVKPEVNDFVDACEKLWVAGKCKFD